ncbi:MAG TPA: hypothetical protein VGN26_09400 [Armatimonadota bacterium]
MSELTSAVVLPPLPEDGAVRQIEGHYHILTIADSPHTFLEHLLTLLSNRASLAAERAPELLELCRDSVLFEDSLRALRSGVGRVEGSAKGVHNGLRRWLFDGSRELHVHQRDLAVISSNACRRLHLQTQQARRQAEHLLASGMRAGVRERKLYFENSVDSLRAVVSSPTGKHDSVAWFQMGWLLWKLGLPVQEAELAFNQSATLGAGDHDLYFVEGLRHLAYMRYLRGDLEGAGQAIANALRHSADHDTSFDAARYAALSGRGSDAASLLKRCIDERPTTILTTLAERDFDCVADLRDQLIRRLVDEAREQARSRWREWSGTLEAIQSAAQEAKCDLSIPSRLREDNQGPHEPGAEMDYFSALCVSEQVESSEGEVVKYARSSLARALDSQVREVLNARIEAEDVRRQAAKLMADARERQREEMEALVLARGQNWFFESLGVGFMICLLVAFAGSMVLIGLSSSNPSLKSLTKDSSVQVTFGYCIAAFMLLGPLGWVGAKHRLREGSFKRRQRMVEFAAARASEQAGTLLREKVPRIEKRLRNADAQRRKTEQALKQLRGISLE